MFWNRFKWNAEQRTAIILAIIAIPEFPFFDFDSDMAEYAVATAPILKKIRSRKDYSFCKRFVVDCRCNFVCRSRNFQANRFRVSFARQCKKSTRTFLLHIFIFATVFGEIFKFLRQLKFTFI